MKKKTFRDADVNSGQRMSPSPENLHLMLSPILEDMNELVSLYEPALDALEKDANSRRFSWIDELSFSAAGLDFVGRPFLSLASTLSNYRLENNSGKTTRTLPGLFNCSPETAAIFSKANDLKQSIKAQSVAVKKWVSSFAELSHYSGILHNKGLDYLIRSELGDVSEESNFLVKRALGGSRVNTKEVYRKYQILPVADTHLASVGWTILRSHISIKRITMYEARLILLAKEEHHPSDPGIKRQLALTALYHPLTPVAITQVHTAPTVRLNYRFAAKRNENSFREEIIKPAMRGTCSGSLPVLYPTEEPVDYVGISTATIEKMHAGDSLAESVKDDSKGRILDAYSLEVRPTFSAIRGYLYVDPDLRMEGLSDGGDLPDDLDW